MIDHNGVEWLPATTTASRLGVAAGTVRAWVSRGKVAAHRIDGRWWVCWDDATRAERDTRGQYLAQRSRSSAH